MSQLPLLDLRAVPSPQWRDARGRFAKAADAVGDELWQMGQEWGPFAVGLLQQATPVRTGATRRAWRADYARSRLSVTVSNKRPTVAFLLGGTQPHNIPGAFGYKMPFGTSGRFEGFFHPGQRPDEALVRAVEQLGERAHVGFSSAGARIVRRLIEG